MIVYGDSIWWYYMVIVYGDSILLHMKETTVATFCRPPLEEAIGSFFSFYSVASLT